MLLSALLARLGGFTEQAPHADGEFITISSSALCHKYKKLD